MSYQPRSLEVDNIESRPIAEDITVVIPTLGRPILEESLYWLSRGTTWPSRLILIDQGDSPQVSVWARQLRSVGFNAEHMPSAQRGRAAGVNRGLERIETCFVAVTDDDCFVDPDWLENMVARLRTYPEAIVTGRVEAAGDGAVMVVMSPEPAIYHRPRLKFDTMSGGNMGTSKAVIERIGLFDEHPSLRTAEDGEWSYRALRCGVPVIYAPEIAVRHFGWRDEDKREAQYRDYARSHGGFYGKYLRQGDWFIALRAIIHHLRALRRWLRGVMIRDQEATLYGRAYFTGLLPGIIAGFRRKQTL